MTFQESIKTCLNKYADFNGRAGLSEYWWFMLFYIVVYIGLAIIAAVTHPFVLVLIFGLFVPIIAAAARRLHDTNRSGWWQLISIIPLVGLVLIYFLVLSGDATDNRFGPPPANPAA